MSNGTISPFKEDNEKDLNRLQPLRHVCYKYIVKTPAKRRHTISICLALRSEQI